MPETRIARAAWVLVSMMVSVVTSPITSIPIEGILAPLIDLNVASAIASGNAEVVPLYRAFYWGMWMTFIFLPSVLLLMKPIAWIEKEIQGN